MRKTLPPVLPNMSAARRYYKKLRAMIDAMLADGGKAPSYWQARFDKEATSMAIGFVLDTSASVHAFYARHFPALPFHPRHDMTKAISENVELIRSIPQQFHDKVELAVDKAFSTGNDLQYLTDRLEELGGITRRRAVLIANDQTSKVTAAYNRAEQLSLGITEAMWHHSSASRDPRLSHLKAGREKLVYNVATGVDLQDGEGLVWPGTLINCRCVATSVVPRHLLHMVK